MAAITVLLEDLRARSRRDPSSAWDAGLARPAARRATSATAPGRCGMTSAAVLGHGKLGHGIRRDPGRRRVRRAAVGRRQERRSTRSTGATNEDYLPGLRLPDAHRATAATSRRAVEGADVVVLAVPSADPAGQPGRLGGAPAADARAVVSLMKGVELGTTMRMSEVIAEAGGVEPAARRRRLGAQPGA